MARIPDLSLILPCYNEELIFWENVREILATLRLSRLTYEVVFVDDVSRDRTREFIARICKNNPGCRALYHKRNTGRGRTVMDGIRASKGKVVGYIDIDLEVSPVYVPNIASYILRGKADVVIGKRVYRTTLASLTREILSQGYRVLADSMVQTGRLDTESGYKFFHRDKILPILNKTKHPHWFWDTEVVVLAKRAGLRIAEVPVLFLRRFDKKSSVRVARDSWDYLVSLWQFRRRLT
jgi:glycosyltransferase involved in cell wall biosynthesis